MSSHRLRARLDEALEPLPTAEGGIVVVLATAGPPPALAMLSSGDVYVEGDTVRVATYQGSSASNRLGGSFSLLVPAGEEALRVEVEDAGSRPAGKLALIEGRIREIRPTAEPPWVMELRFRPAGEGAGVEGFLSYWRAVRSWLATGATGEPSVPVPQ
ncbi:MAG: hypothetical protein ACRD02_06130 [Acidimicrobiia bacterium]